MPRTVRLEAPNGSRFELEVEVAERPAAGPAPREVSPEQDAALRAVEAAHGGAVPVTEAEFHALTTGDAAALLALAGRASSHLRHLFPTAGAGG